MAIICRITARSPDAPVAAQYRLTARWHEAEASLIHETRALLLSRQAIRWIAGGTNSAAGLEADGHASFLAFPYGAGHHEANR